MGAVGVRSKTVEIISSKVVGASNKISLVILLAEVGARKTISKVEVGVRKHKMTSSLAKEAGARTSNNNSRVDKVVGARRTISNREDKVVGIRVAVAVAGREGSPATSAKHFSGLYDSDRATSYLARMASIVTGTVGECYYAAYFSLFVLDVS